MIFVLQPFLYSLTPQGPGMVYPSLATMMVSQRVQGGITYNPTPWHPLEAWAPTEEQATNADGWEAKRKHPFESFRMTAAGRAKTRAGRSVCVWHAQGNGHTMGLCRQSPSSRGPDGILMPTRALKRQSHQTLEDHGGLDTGPLVLRIWKLSLGDLHSTVPSSHCGIFARPWEKLPFKHAMSLPLAWCGSVSQI